MNTLQPKVFFFIKNIIFLSVLFGFIFSISGCGDFVTETDTGACINAIDERDYDTALSACTSRKDKATAYMGKAGYDIVNLLKASSAAPIAYTAPSGVELGTDDISGATILNILQLSTDVISDDSQRATAITNSKNYLDNASALLHPYLNDNSSPLSADEILLDTFALAFSMQLFQVITYDNATTATSVVPSADNSGNLSCPEVDGSDGNDAQAMLKSMDGHLWTTERNATQCNLMKTTIDSLSTSDKNAVLVELANWASAGGLLPSAIRTAVCEPLDSLLTYLSKLTDSVSKLSLSGDNTKAITDAQTSTNNLLKQVGCKE